MVQDFLFGKPDRLLLRGFILDDSDLSGDEESYKRHQLLL